ncbi:Glycosyltransferase family 28 C-terminal domain-containing protein [Litoreibacter ascidiaceicola]|uniref:Glycosyltransferase family 28 C-terminal domain-containing protein n=1 Tax=Litoreibacter ascidiaceicola TaxID=1486859 RepID=A0A1M5B8P6_9RHOB|nr:glycosyltransferase [Litoreibacter ascidiaceicola]SHF38815.1 Glycosyltransferase family 28 C-terminal domain-containing protein [Litoreibacter ascidiaceicola]
MIFVTVGTQLPFPRLIKYMARWAQSHSERVVLQTGDGSGFNGCEAYRSLPSDQFGTFMTEARVIVSHAGIGSILAAKALNKPIVVIPRRAKLSEHRNDHQLATAAALEGRAGLRVAWELDQLPAFLDGPIEPPEMALHPQFNQLVERISTFVGA